MDNIEKIPIAIVRIVTPSEFYIQFTNSIDALDDQNANFDQHMENNNIELKKATSTATLSSIRGILRFFLNSISIEMIFKNSPVLRYMNDKNVFAIVNYFGF